MNESEQARTRGGRRRFRRVLLASMAGLLVLCLVLAAVSFLVNRGRPTTSGELDRLSEVQKARLAETVQVRQALGEAVWPGWGEVDIPLILFNESYAFLVGLPEPADGWTRFPNGDQHGGAWQAAPDERFAGQPYYRLRLPASGETPQAFVVQVGERWAASLGTLEWMRLSLAEQWADALPPVLADIFPYGLAVGLFLPNSDTHIAALAHESFHAYQAMVAPERLAASERAEATLGQLYPREEESHRQAWQVELDLLADAVEAESETDVVALAREFLSHRAERRRAAGLSADLVDYERHREWSEGLAKYVELAVWRQADATADYRPDPALAEDPEFDDYAGFQTHWNREVDQIRRMAGDDGDGRFYYSGFAQAALLDRLMPGWKAQALDEGVFLEGLLEEAVGGRIG